MTAAKVTAEELRQGWIACPDCKTRAHIMTEAASARLKPGYKFERCPECQLWMANVADIGGGDA